MRSYVPWIQSQFGGRNTELRRLIGAYVCLTIELSIASPEPHGAIPCSVICTFLVTIAMIRAAATNTSSPMWECRVECLVWRGLEGMQTSPGRLGVATL